MSVSKKKSWLRRIGHFGSDKRGVTAIEMALIAPFLFYLSIVTIEIGIVIFVGVVVEGATSTAARNAKTGATQAGISREDFIRQEVVNRSAGLLNPDVLVFQLTSYQDSNPGAGNPGSAGGAGDLVVMTVEYPWQIITPIVNQFFGDTYNITSQATFRNEPY